ncbi:hypothetical protein CHUAL_008894 [Chamberlinius hualienensis]
MEDAPNAICMHVNLKVICFYLTIIMFPITTCFVTGLSAKFNRQRKICQRRGAISIERDQNRDYHIQFITGNSCGDSSSSQMFTNDKTLILDLPTDDGQQRRTGSFLSLRKRRRKFQKRLSLSEDTQDEEELFDDVYPKQTTKILSQIDQWDFNTFALDLVTAGRPLPTLLLHLFHHYGLIRIFNLDVVKVWKCFAMIEDGYHSKNPYHNAVHATDVTQAMHCFLQETMILNHSSPMEIMTSLLAAVTHDLDHPGVNQPFLIATSNHLAALYKNSSVLENHHWRSAICCLMQSGMLDHFDRNQWDDVTYQIRSLILATDITRQNEFLTRLKNYMEENSLDMSDPQYRHFILQIALKCADICNPCRTWEISSRWSRKVCEEFFRQGDVERKLNLPVTALCDRYNTTIAKIQTGFFQFVVTPLFEAWNHLLQTPLSTSLMNNLRINQKIWEKMVLDESETLVSLPNTDKLNSQHCEVIGKLVSPVDFCDVWMLDSSGRRHSAPVNCPCNFTQMQSSISSQSLGAPANWATSFSTMVQSSFSDDKNRVSDAVIECQSGTGTVRSFPRQSTFPLPQRLQTESISVETDSPKCINGCGTSSESSEDVEMDEDSSQFILNDDCRKSFDLFQKHKKSKPLVRLKSDSDLTININGKIKTQLTANKENAEPKINSTVQWTRNSYRKIKCQGLNCPRLSFRRSSAPVGVMHEELTKCLNSIHSEIVEKPPAPKRRDSAPVVFLPEQLTRVQPKSVEVNGNRLRRGSLPNDLVDSAVIQVTVDVSSTNNKTSTNISPSNNKYSTTCTNDKNINISLNCRRQSMPTEVGKRSHIVKLNEMLSLAGSSLEKGVQFGCSLTQQTDRLHLLSKAQSFDSTSTDENGGDGHNGLMNWLKDLPNRRVLFPLHRRSSVPTEAWLFSSSTSDEQPNDLIVDLGC